MSLFISLLTEFLLFLLPAQRDRRSPQRRFFTNRYRGKYKYQLDFELSWHTYNSLKMKWLHNAQSLFKNTALLLRRPTNLHLISNFKKNHILFFEKLNFNWAHWQSCSMFTLMQPYLKVKHTRKCFFSLIFCSRGLN